MFDYTKDETMMYTVEQANLRIVIELKGNAMQFPRVDEITEAFDSLMRAVYPSYHAEDE